MRSMQQTKKSPRNQVARYEGPGLAGVPAGTYVLVGSLRERVPRRRRRRSSSFLLGNDERWRGRRFNNWRLFELLAQGLPLAIFSIRSPRYTEQKHQRPQRRTCSLSARVCIRASLRDRKRESHLAKPFTFYTRKYCLWPGPIIAPSGSAAQRRSLASACLLTSSAPTAVFDFTRVHQLRLFFTLARFLPISSSRPGGRDLSREKERHRIVLAGFVTSPGVVS